jgi:hypothetical protein
MPTIAPGIDLSAMTRWIAVSKRSDNADPSVELASDPHAHSAATTMAVTATPLTTR